MYTTVISTGIAGLLLLFLEMFLPGLIAGIIGGVLLIIAVIMAYSNHGAEAGNLTLLLAVLSTSGLWWWWATRFQHTRFGKSMTLETAITARTNNHELYNIVGKSGSAVTPLKPGGTISVDGRRFDAITDGDWVETGTTVRVVSVQGISVLVRRAST